MTLLVAGGGKVATALADALAASGARVVRWSRKDGAYDALGAEGVAAPECAIIAVTDRAIAEVAERLLVEGLVSHATVLLHTAGAIAPEQAFAPVAGSIGGAGLLHPLRAFAGRAEDAVLAGTVFGVAGDERALAAATRVVALLRGTPLPLSTDGLARYHAAAVLASNHTLGLAFAAVRLLEASGLPRRDAERALGGLLASAAANVIALGLPAALTGPIARGDELAVARHLAALAEPTRALYVATAVATLELAREQGAADPTALAAIGRLLAAAPSGGDAAAAIATPRE